eukprot:1186961-Prorocentrum_minimum.AAC.5
MGGRAAGKSALGSWGLGTRGCSAVCECERAEGEGQPSAIGERAFTGVVVLCVVDILRGGANGCDAGARGRRPRGV